MIDGECRPRAECVFCTVGYGTVKHAGEVWMEDACTNCTCAG